jgi:hypothetical protein
MNNTPCTNFFCQPTHPLHRRYEALRAVFLEHRPLQEVAAAFGYAYGSLRNLVTDFRAQCQAGQIPPFSLTRLGDDPLGRLLRTTPHDRTRQQSPTAVTSPSRPGDSCARAWRASSSSCRCWLASASIPWSLRRAIPGRA